MAEWFGEAPSNPKSCDLTADPEHCAIFHAGDDRLLEGRLVLDDTDQETASTAHRRDCVPYSEWVNAWNTLRAELRWRPW